MKKQQRAVLAEEARRRRAAGRYLRRQRIPKLGRDETAELQAIIVAEVAAAKRPTKKHNADFERRRRARGPRGTIVSFLGGLSFGRAKLDLERCKDTDRDVEL